jgi:hypothetical protein
MSEAQLAITRDIAAIELWLEHQRGRMSAGENVDVDVFSRVSNQRRRLAEALYGTALARHQRDVTPSLTEYLTAKRAEPTGASSAPAVSAEPSPPSTQPAPSGEVAPR